MNKLELSEICGYLPWGLKVERRTEETQNIITLTPYILGLWQEDYYTSFKPLVLPLSALTESDWVQVFKAGLPAFADVESDYYVTQNKGFVTIEYRQWSTRIKVTYGITHREFNISGGPAFNQLAAFTKLYELHADIGDLIGQGKALDKRDFK